MSRRAVVCVASSEETRVQAAAKVLARAWHLPGPLTSTPEEASLVVDGLSVLRAKGLLFEQAQAGKAEDMLVYGPSPEAKETISAERSSSWGPRVEKYLAHDVQTIRGALFAFPLEGSGERLRAFITDWSPFPAACALAVQRGHPLAGDGQRGPDRFTGHFVRHPLTGDLLPVWTAAWIKPGLGTGTVVINPAHSQADLDFAREVGLPVRFALAPMPPTERAETWIAPPFVAAGIAVRTGIADGVKAEEARSTYISKLETAGWAVRFIDRVLGSLSLAQAPHWPVGQDPASRSRDITLSPDAATILSGPLGSGAIFVATRGSLQRLLLLRALHIDIHGHDIVDPQVVVMGQLAGLAPEKSTKDAVELASLSVARNEETASLKPQQLEQVKRFIANHDSLRDSFKDDGIAFGKRTANVLSTLRQGRFSDAFAELYKVQRDLIKAPALLEESDRVAYFALAYALAGLEPPSGYDLKALLGRATTGEA